MEPAASSSTDATPASVCAAMNASEPVSISTSSVGTLMIAVVTPNDPRMEATTPPSPGIASSPSVVVPSASVIVQFRSALVTASSRPPPELPLPAPEKGSGKGASRELIGVRSMVPWPPSQASAASSGLVAAKANRHVSALTSMSIQRISPGQLGS